MPKMRFLLARPAALGAAACVMISACSRTAEDRGELAIECPVDMPRCFGATSSGAGGTTHPDCAGEPTEEKMKRGCGVFAQADARSDGDGTRERPHTKLKQAIDKAASDGQPVYACAGAAYEEAVTISAGVEIYGGFDCAAGWGWKPETKSALNGPADAVALTVTAAAKDARVQNFAITAASSLKPGTSSIAVAVEDVAAALVRCDIKAGDGANGEPGAPPSVAAMNGADAAPPEPATMNACVLPDVASGGAPGVTLCEDGETAGGIGGRAGIPGISNGQSGADGQPTDGTGKGGAGAVNFADCNDGTNGSPGAPGDPGVAGPAATSPHTLSLTGFLGGDGGDGRAGARGQGGGGGGGAKAGSFCGAPTTPKDGPGASGGGGGGGGCGGKGGGGGKAGGSSIAIVSLGSNLSLTEVALAVGKAGNGGSGASGQRGGLGGSGASGGQPSNLSGSKAGCSGAKGGAGGDGGPGGGGRGGHAIGVAYASAPPELPAINAYTPGTPGAGGDSGPGTPAGNTGAPGNAASCWDLSSDKSCAGEGTVAP